MFLDVATIYIKAGNGGDGAVSWHREKYVAAGGPDGGDGGKGGDIYFEASAAMNSLAAFRYSQHFRAENGTNGSGRNCTGRAGKDLVVKVPCGTVVKDAESGGIIADVYKEGDRILILQGGRGGRGNARFATAQRRSPGFSETGERTVERKIILELKTIADVGLVGFPNVGKSTLLSVISAARPKIADYHFTTLSPNLGTVVYGDDSFVVADIPGLIEGASKGVGLGHSFLRHVERVRLIVHLVDISGIEGRDPAEDYIAIRKELTEYSPELGALPEIGVANKCDLQPDESAFEALEKVCGSKVLRISAATTAGIEEFKRTIAAKLEELPPAEPLRFIPFEYETKDRDSFEVHKENGVYYVTGGYVEELARRVVLNDGDSFRWFQKVLREKGVINELRAQGIGEGDVVDIMGVEFEYVP